MLGITVRRLGKIVKERWKTITKVDRVGQHAKVTRDGLCNNRSRALWEFFLRFVCFCKNGDGVREGKTL